MYSANVNGSSALSENEARNLVERSAAKYSKGRNATKMCKAKRTMGAAKSAHLDRDVLGSKDVAS